ncbi:MAG: aminoacyl-tRNA hydrolase [Burkholderiales bacterium]|nr:aminoacyl-tRNA hydrolase [Burkholderiales bacterium]
MKTLHITPHLALDAGELEFRFVRASGPGGQNVNKVSSAVELRFDAAGSSSLPQEIRARLIRLAGNRATADGVIIIDARRHRSQTLNRLDAIERLLELIREAAERRRPRIATAPTAASQRRRVEGKRERSGIKRQRGRVADDE